jgi:hypothetical protein
VDYILFHVKKVDPLIPCIDGLFAASAAYRAMPEAKLVPAEYGKPPSLELAQGDRVYLLDLTYRAQIIEQWAEVAQVIVLDHHKQAMQDLSGLSDRVLRTFRMDRSGAMIAWKHFHPADRPPLLYRYVQDRDLFAKALPCCDLVHFGLVEAFDEKPLDKMMLMARLFTSSEDSDFFLG